MLYAFVLYIWGALCECHAMEKITKRTLSSFRHNGNNSKFMVSIVGIEGGQYKKQKNYDTFNLVNNKRNDCYLLFISDCWIYHERKKNI